MNAMDSATRTWVHNKFVPTAHQPLGRRCCDRRGYDHCFWWPWTWFFELPGDVIGKLTLGYVGLDGQAWRVSYPGIKPHGGFLDPEFGLVVAYTHGPKQFEINFEKENLAASKLNGTNSWIDFTTDKPKLLEEATLKT